MNQNIAPNARGFFNSWRLVGWGAIVGLVLLPAVAMACTTEVSWTAKDFVAASVMLGGVGIVFEIAVRASGSLAYRLGAAVALGLGLILLWANAAVGIVGSEDRPINLWFNIIPFVAFVAAIVARFRPRGMAVAMTIAAVAQMLAGVVVYLSGHLAWVVTGVGVTGWLLSAWLFHRAARGS